MSIPSLSPASTDASAVKHPEPMFYVVSVKKLFIMTFFTLGLYHLCWSYRNWMLYQQATGENIAPGWRSVLSVLFIYPLLNSVDRRIRSSGRAYAWSPGLLSLGVALVAVSPSVLLHIVENVFRRIPLSELLVVLIPLGAASFWLMGRAQQAINFCELDPAGRSNAELSMTDLVCALLDALCWGGLW